MKKYDLFTIIKPNLDNDDADKVVNRVEEIVKNLGQIKWAEKNLLMK